MVLNRKNNGAVLLAVTWVLLILTGIMITLGYQAQLETLLLTGYREELETRVAARNLLQLVIHRLQNDDSDYDAPGTIDFPYALATELGYTYAAEVELWDEGSRFNLNNTPRSEEHTSELQSRPHLVCRLLLEKKNTTKIK